MSYIFYKRVGILALVIGLLQVNEGIFLEFPITIIIVADVFLFVIAIISLIVYYRKKSAAQIK